MATKKRQTEHHGLAPDGGIMICDSKEEVYFTWWLKELVDAGYVADYGRCSTQLLAATCKRNYMVPVPKKTKEGGLKLNSRVEVVKPGHEYTPDFWAQWNDMAIDVLFGRDWCAPVHGVPFWNSSPLIMRTIFEVKPTFDAQNMTRAAKINISWMHEQYGIKISLAKVGNGGGLFKDTFTPRRFLKQDKKGGLRTLKFEPVMLDDYIKEREKLIKNVKNLT